MSQADISDNQFVMHWCYLPIRITYCNVVSMRFFYPFLYGYVCVCSLFFGFLYDENAVHVFWLAHLFLLNMASISAKL